MNFYIFANVYLTLVALLSVFLLSKNLDSLEENKIQDFILLLALFFLLLAMFMPKINFFGFTL